jgi:hypothetical protein
MSILSQDIKGLNDRTYRVRQQLLAKHSGLHQSSISKALQSKKAAIEKKKRQIHNLQQEAYQLRQSLSWKVSSPLRWIAHLFTLITKRP